jgi:hypothetical protein
MCLITQQEKPFIARKPLIVYKFVRINQFGFLKGLFYPFSYQLNTTYETLITQGHDIYGFFDLIASEKYNNRTGKKLISYESGFHTISEFRLKKMDKPKLTEPEKIVLVECTIPKGSTYYRDKTGLLVSNQIIINQIVSGHKFPDGELLETSGNLCGQFVQRLY